MTEIIPCTQELVFVFAAKGNQQNPEATMREIHLMRERNVFNLNVRKSGDGSLKI